MNSGLDLIVHHLFAVYSGGKLSLDGAGYQPNTNQTGTGVGTGKFMFIAILSNPITERVFELDTSSKCDFL